MKKRFFGVLLGVSVLPALVVIPAMAVSITEDINLNDIFQDGNLTEELWSKSGFVGTMTSPRISISGTVETLGSGYLVHVANTGSGLNLGTLENPVDSIDINHSGDNARAVTVWDGGEINLYGGLINISGDAQGLTVWGDYTNDLAGSATVVGEVVDISGSNALYVNEGTSATIQATHSLNISGDNGIAAWGKSLGSSYVAGGIVDVDTKNLNITVTGTGIGANYGKSQITVDAEGDVNIIANGSDDTRAVHAGNATVYQDIDKADTSFVSIKANNINLTADDIGVSAMSNGWIDLDGNVTIRARDAVLARGQAVVNINESGEHTVKMDGDLALDYYGANSGSEIDANVNVVFNGQSSYWNGNTVVSYGYYTAYQTDGEGNILTDENGDLIVQTSNEPTEVKMQVNSVNITLQNGATWNATKITDCEETEKGVVKIAEIEYPADFVEGRYYNALNYLTMNNGVVNIADNTRGITVENANIQDATFNGGMLNIGNMTLTGGTNTFNNDVFGTDGESVLTVNSDAVMNIGTNNININTITLNGNMLATLRPGDAQITADNFNGDGTLTLLMKNAGTYNVFGNESFSNIAWNGIGVTDDNPVYNLVWNGGSVTAERKSVEEIAEHNNLSEESSSTVYNLMDSSSTKLNDLGMKIQEKLAAVAGADDKTKAAIAQEVENASKAIHPEKESVTQSVASSVQNTVTNLASARMNSPMIGRNGGDINMTSGGIWAHGLFNKSKQSDDFHGYTRGIAIGVDGTMDKIVTLGLGYSFAHTDVTGSARDTEIDSNTMFLYGQYKPSQWYVNAVANYTMSDYSETGTAMGMPVFADYDVDSTGVGLAVGYDADFGVTPELGLRYMHVMTDDYTNSLGVKTKSDDTNFLTGVFGVRYVFDVIADKYTTFIPQLNAAVKYDMLSDKNIATIVMPGIDTYTLDIERLSRIGGEFGIGLGMKFRGIDLSANYDIDVRKDYTSQTGMLKFRYCF